MAFKSFSVTCQENRLAFPVCCTPPVEGGLSPLHCILSQLKVFQSCGEDRFCCCEVRGGAGEERGVKLLLPGEVRGGGGGNGN